MSTKAELEAQRIYAPNIKHNSALQNVKFIATCFSGAAAGVLGLEKYAGFALFVGSTLLTAASIFVVNCKGRPVAYVHGGLLELANPGQENLMTFLLLWTLFYGLVHVYD